jgi:hypothetical protein
MKTCVGADVQIQVFLTSALVGEWIASSPGRSTPVENLGIDEPQSWFGRRGEHS